MPHITLFHNPKAGEGNHSKKELVGLIEDSGYQCQYFSTKKKAYKHFRADTDIVVAAGGDGTVGKILKRLVARKLTNRYKIAVFPLGTANNIAGSLSVEANVERQIRNWKNVKTKKFDLLRTGGDVQAVCFESVGSGIFTALMSEMKSDKVKLAPAEKLQMTLKRLRETVASYPARTGKVMTDQTVHSGSYLWIEIMNIGSIGPNIEFSPRADPGDGLLKVLMIEENQRKNLLEAIDRRLSGAEDNFVFKSFAATNAEIQFDDSRLHIDDELVDMGKPVHITVQIQPQVFEFLA